MIKFDNFTVENGKLTIKIENQSKDFHPTIAKDETERIKILIQARMDHCLKSLKDNLSYIDYSDDTIISWLAPGKERDHFTPFTYNAMEQYMIDGKLTPCIIIQAQKEMFFERHSLGCSDYDADELFNYLHELLAYAINCEATGREFDYPFKG